MNGRQRAAMAVEARRGRLGMSREELAAKAKVDPKTIYNLEKNGKWPIARTRARIELALDWPNGELERIAAREPDERPAISPKLLADIRKELPDPEDQQRVIEIFERRLRGEPPPSASAQSEEGESDDRQAAG